MKINELMKTMQKTKSIVCLVLVMLLVFLQQSCKKSDTLIKDNSYILGDDYVQDSDIPEIPSPSGEEQTLVSDDYDLCSMTPALEGTGVYFCATIKKENADATKTYVLTIPEYVLDTTTGELKKVVGIKQITVNNSIPNNVNYLKVIVPSYVKIIKTGALADINKTYTKEDSTPVVIDNNSNLRMIEFAENSVHTIEAGAFAGVGRKADGTGDDELLKVVTLPKSLTVIGDFAFAECPNIERLILNEGLTKIGEFAFASEFIALDGTTIEDPARVTFDKLKELILPTTLIDIERGAFLGQAEVDKLVIPAGVTDISAGVFANWRELKSLSLPKAVVNVGNYAFGNCPIEDLILPENLEFIGEGAFLNSRLNDKFLLGAKVRSIGNSAFMTNNPKDLACLRKVVIHKGILYVGNSAFKGVRVKELVLSADTKYGAGVFTADTNGVNPQGMLEKIAFIGNCDSITVDMFKGQKALTTVFLPNTVKFIGTGAFDKCVSLRDIVLPSSVETIGDRAFINCPLNSRFRFPSGLKSIGEEAFRLNVAGGGFVGIQDEMGLDVVLGSNLKTVGANAFTGRIFTDFTFDGATIFDGATAIHDRVVRIEVTGNTTAVPDRMFEDKIALETVILPNSVRSIGKGAFFQCKNLTNFIIPPFVEIIGDKAFTKCEKLTIVNMLSVMLIGASAFNGCKDLTILNMPCVTTIGDGAFGYCIGLTTVDMPRVTTIEDYAFGGCIGLTTLNMPISCCFGVTPFASDMSPLTVNGTLGGTDRSGIPHYTSSGSITTPFTDTCP